MRFPLVGLDLRASLGWSRTDILTDGKLILELKSFMNESLKAASRQWLTFTFDEERIAPLHHSEYCCRMTGQEVKALPVEQKIKIMEAIWEDFRDRFERMSVPEELRSLLDQRRARVREGTVQLLDWDAVKGSIGRR